jgi:hypothetical protein
LPSSIRTLFPTLEAFLDASPIELERAVLRVYRERTDDQLRRMTTPQSIATELFEAGGYTSNDPHRRNEVDIRISRASKMLDDTQLIQEPDTTNGKNGFRVISDKGRQIVGEVDFIAARIRSRYSRDMFHADLPDAAWNAFRSGDYDTAVYEAFKALESSIRKKGIGQNSIGATDHGVSLMLKAFDVNAGPLTDKAAPKGRTERRRELFSGAFGELRNPVAQGDPKITDPLVAVEEMIAAGMLQRIVDAA